MGEKEGRKEGGKECGSKGGKEGGHRGGRKKVIKLLLYCPEERHKGTLQN